MKKYAHKIGAVFYVLWGLLHVLGGVAIMSEHNTAAQIAMQSTALQPDSFMDISSPALSGILSYHGFNIIWFGVFAIVVGIFYNWKNSKGGYWLNLAVLSAIELGLIIFLLLPGYMSLSDGGIGLSLFILALIFSTIGVRQAESKAFAPA